MKISNKLREVAEKMAAVAGVLGVLSAPALAGNGCQDVITANCVYVKPIAMNFCAPAYGFKTIIVTGQCQQYRRTSDNFQFLTSPQGGSTNQQACFLQNDRC